MNIKAPFIDELLPFHRWRMSYTPVIPTFYWDSVSPEQQLLELCRQWDAIIKYEDLQTAEVNEIVRQVNEMLASFDDKLNADVIAKIQQMVDDGTLTPILQQAIEAWMDERSAQVDANTEAIATETTRATTRENEIANTVEEGVNEINARIDNVEESVDAINARIDSVEAFEDTYYFHTLFATPYYYANDSKRGMQGGCVLPDGSIIQYTGSMLQHWSESGVLIGSNVVDLGHGNACCYNDSTNTVFITSTQEDGRRFLVYEINPSNLLIINTVDCANKAFPDEPYGIAWDAKKDNFVFVNFWNPSSTNYMWATDSNFNIIKVKEMPFNVRSIANIGLFGDYLAIVLLSTQSIILVDREEWKFKKTVNYNEMASNTWFISEPEWIDTRNGKVFLGFIPYSDPSHTVGGGTKVISYFDPSINYNETVKSGNTELPPSNELYYVDATNETTTRDGSSNNPFSNLYEAINSSLRSENVTGRVQINIVSQGQNIVSPSFVTNKKYVLLYTESNAIFGSLSIGDASEVFINKPYTATTKANLHSLGEANITVRGKLVCNSTLTLPENGNIASSYNGVIKSNISANTETIDFQYFYGSFVATKNALLQESKIANYTGSKSFVGIPIQLADVSSAIPTISGAMFARIRFNIGSKQYEEIYPIIAGQYQSFERTADGTTVKVEIATSGVVTVTNATLNRIIIQGVASF